MLAEVEERKLGEFGKREEAEDFHGCQPGVASAMLHPVSFFILRTR